MGRGAAASRGVLLRSPQVPPDVGVAGGTGPRSPQGQPSAPPLP